MSNFSLSTFIGNLSSAEKQNRSALQVPFSKLTFAVFNFLLKEGYFAGGFLVKKFSRSKNLVVFLHSNRRFFTRLKIVSKPSRPIFVDIFKLHGLLRNTRGQTLVLSTTSGLLFGHDAFRLGLGGEVLFIF